MTAFYEPPHDITHRQAGPGLLSPRTPAAREPRRPISTVELSSCQGQTDLLCSSKVQQPDRLTSDLH